VLQVWGTDIELARRAPALVGPLVRGAHVVVAASVFLGDEARALGAREIAIVPPPVDVPDHVAEPESPPHVLYAGRLSEEKGILEFVEATNGLPRVIVGDGPLRGRVPDATGFVPPAELGPYYARASVVCVPSRREGYGITAREALAYGRPVVATRVGGLADLAGPGVTLVPPRDVPALRGVISASLAGARLHEQEAAAVRSFARSHWAPSVVGVALAGIYDAARTTVR
jgi:glycosyltransferase involved in cell wall biosynthesis